VSLLALKDTIEYFDFVAPAALTLGAWGDCGGFDRQGVETRARVYQSYYAHIGLWSFACLLPEQAHGTRVRMVSSRILHSHVRRTDGLISSHHSISLAITVADCLPIYIAVPSRGIIGLLHSGRRSTGILARALKMLKKHYSVNSDEVHLLFGPAIQSCCYEVDARIALPYQKKWGEDSVITRGSGYYLDMFNANKNIAQRHGVTKIDVVDECTHCNARYHSYRREGENYKRMLAIISPYR